MPILKGRLNGKHSPLIKIKENKMYTIRKLFKFETAHVLNTSYSKECQCLHGHSYKLEIIISTQELNKDGMVLDFKKLKEIINSKIINEFDHAFIMSRNQENNSAIKLVTNGLVLVDYNPTAENM